MRYVSLKEAEKNVKEVKIEKVIKTISEYVGASDNEARLVILPILELLEKSERENKPIICIWRHLATAQIESWIVKCIAEKINGTPVWFTYNQDAFMKDNAEKIIFEKIRMFVKKGKNVRRPIHLCDNLAEIEGMAFNKITTKMDGKSLIDFHLELREKAGFPKGNIIDLGQIFKDLLCLSPDKEKFLNGNGQAKKEWYYPLWMYLSSKLIVLEDFEVCDMGMKELVENSYNDSLTKGLVPNFVRLKTISAVDWYMTRPEPDGVPKEIEKILEEIMAR